MTCPRCQTDNPPQAKFCSECAAPLVARCASCGTQLPASAKFCLECAHPVGGTTAGPPRFASPESYTPKHLAEKILTSKAALEGERKQVTVLFADLKGSMELLADRDPEDARKLLDPVLEHMMEAVHRYEGTVNQVMGDGIMALFGAPLAHEDHAVRACYAALRMQESVKRYAEGVRREHGVTIRIRVGLNSGEVVVRAIGSDLHMDYTAVGQTTHLAARMEQLADPGATLLTPETLALAEGFVQVTSLGPMAVKGLAAPVEVYELTGISAARSRLQAAAARGLSRFVGRDAEIEQLRRAVDQARQGRGQVTAVVGGAGVGKSRLTFELTHSHRLEGWLILQAGALSYGKATSYLPVIDLLKNYFRIGDRDSPREIREKVSGRLLMLDRALEATVPALLALLDVSGDDPQWQALDPPQRRQRTLEAVKRLLLREAQVQPLLVVFEDLHWIDSETQALLDSLVESLPPARLLLLINYRPEYAHRWGSKTSYTQLRLDPLPPESAFELLHGLLGEDGTIEPLTPILMERTEGNPFFLEETVRALVETKALVGERGAYRLAKILTDIQVPPTVQAILAARIDRLSLEDKRLLQSAAVIGKDVPFALLAAIVEEREEELRRGLARLQGAQFLYEVSLFQDLEYTFVHALTHEVAYGSVLHERRRALHTRLVEVIETLHGERLAEHVEQLAHHAFLAEVWPKAATYLREAAAKANGRCAYRQAAASFEQALGAVAKLPGSRAKTEQAIDIMCRIRGTLLPLGEASRAFGHLREAERLARGIDDRRRLAMVLGAMSHHYWFEGDPAETRRFGQEALEIAKAVGDLSIQISVSNRLGMAHMFWGEARPAQLLLRNVVELVGEDTVLKTSSITPEGVTCRALLASTLAHIGEFRKGLDYGEEALRIAEHFDHPNSVAYALLHLSWLCDLQGNLSRALILGQRAISICRELNISFLLVSLLGIVGHAQVRSGRPDEALLGIREGLAIQEAMGYRSTMSAMVSMLAEAYLAAGQLPAASDEARRALALARECGERFEEARGLWVLGHVHAHPDHLDLEAADQAYQQSLVLATALDMRPLVAQCHLGLAKLSRLTGNRHQVEEHLATATTMFREMDMEFWLGKASAELAALR